MLTQFLQGESWHQVIVKPRGQCRVESDQSLFLRSDDVKRSISEEMPNCGVNHTQVSAQSGRCRVRRNNPSDVITRAKWPLITLKLNLRKLSYFQSIWSRTNGEKIFSHHQLKRSKTAWAASKFLSDLDQHAPFSRSRVLRNPI